MQRNGLMSKYIYNCPKCKRAAPLSFCSQPIHWIECNSDDCNTISIGEIKLAGNVKGALKQAFENTYFTTVNIHFQKYHSFDEFMRRCKNFMYYMKEGKING